MTIKFGPATLGGVKDAVKNLEYYHSLGLKACEIAFTRGAYIKEEKDMKRIKEAAEKFDIQLSIHAPYYVNLNSKEEEKIVKSKERILKCCEVGEKLGVYMVVFHPGYYSGMDKNETYDNIKNAILDMMEVIKKKKWKVKIAAETMGKINVFGSVEQINNLVRDTGCDFCIDFAHILAREKIVDYEKVIRLFSDDKWHVHFSGIVYGEKGEKHHKITEKEEWRVLLENLPKDKDIVIINESPSPIEDSVKGLEIWDEKKK